MPDEPNEEKHVTDGKIYNYWMSAFKRAAKKMPVEQWEVAEKRFRAFTGGDEKKKPVVNDLRNHIEISRAFLDQRDPSFEVTVSPGYFSNKKAQNMAKGEKAFLEYVWREQGCQQVESQKLDSALIRNVGFTMPIFDFKKGMPDLRYLPAKDVRIDPDCGGLLARASWMAFKEDISIEELKATVPDITKEEIESIKKKNPSVLEEEEAEGTENKELYLSVTRWHVYARNDAAIRDFTKMETEDETEPVALVDELKLKTMRRYLQFVDGISRPVKDENEWPFELDHKEFPISMFLLNHVPEDLYGFTDYQQMERMDIMSDQVMQWVELDTYYSAITKYLGSDEKGMPPKAEVDDFLNENRRSYLPNMLGDDGKPLMQEMKVGAPSPHLKDSYELMSKESKNSSGDTELSIESIADYKEVTAAGVKADLERRQQRSNLRLSGPRGYEKSIQEDAVKMLEIAHQFVPKLSVISRGQRDEAGQEILESMRWEDAEEAIAKGADLVKLGVDAIIGEELAADWVTSDEVSMTAIRLSTKVSVTPGSTRNLTQDQQASALIEFYTEVLYPTIYQPMALFDLASKYLEYAASFIRGLERIKDFLPTTEKVDEFRQQQEQAAQAEQQQAQQQAEIEQAQGEQQMQVESAKGDNEQRSAELQLGTQAAKSEIEIASAQQKMQLDERKAKMQLKAKPKKASA